MSEITEQALDHGIAAMMRDRFGVLAQSISCARETVMLQVVKSVRPDWYINHRNRDWKRSAYLRRRRGWAPQ